jgi:hypothetical protein
MEARRMVHTAVGQSATVLEHLHLRGMGQAGLRVTCAVCAGLFCARTKRVLSNALQRPAGFACAELRVRMTRRQCAGMMDSRGGSASTSGLRLAVSGGLGAVDFGGVITEWTWQSL